MATGDVQITGQYELYILIPLVCAVEILGILDKTKN